MSGRKDKNHNIVFFPSFLEENKYKIMKHLKFQTRKANKKAEKYYKDKTCYPVLYCSFYVSTFWLKVLRIYYREFDFRAEEKKLRFEG